MDIVVPYRKEANEIELTYCLRSIEKYLTGYRDIWVIGDKPSLKVKHLPCSDIQGRKEYSIAWKISHACKCDAISENFIMFNDDHFLLKPLDISEIKYWHNGPLEDAKERGSGGYRRAVMDTIEKLNGGLNYDIHTPIIYNKKHFLRLFTWQEELCVKSMYCNQMNVEGEFMTDCKLNFPYSKTAIEEKLKDRLFFSTGHFVMIDEMLEVFNELYPNPSKYE